MSTNVDQFAVGVLRGLGAPVTPQNIAGIRGWAAAEGGAPHNNPLNTTESYPGASTFNSVGVKTYRSPQDAVAATLATLKNGRYGGIIGALHASNPRALAAAIGSSPWGTSGSLVSQTIDSALRAHPQVPLGGLGRPLTQPVKTGRGTPGSSQTFTTGGGIDWAGAARAAVAREAAKPINPSGKFTAGNPLADLNYLANSGKYQLPTQKTTVKTPAIPGLVQPSSGGGTQPTAPGAGDVNPLHHFTLGRSDMGVDANAAPGTPILAPNDAKVVGILNNWYKGQPYVALKLLAGPNKGKVLYVAEQISGIPRDGQIIRRGQPIAHYASSGTGIEIGWASPHNPFQTLAQATTGYSEGQVTQAGSAFRNYLNSTR